MGKSNNKKLNNIKSSENIEKIEEVPSIPAEIIEAASNGRLVVFIGAGVSRIIGCPSWEEFALKYLEYLQKEGIISFHEHENLKSLDARKLLSICRNIFIQNNIKPPSMKSIFEGNKDLIKKYKIYDDLYSFNSIYVTTNYDTFLDDLAINQTFKQELRVKSEEKIDAEINERKPPDRVFFRKEDILIDKLKNGNIIHLHGSLNNENEAIMTIMDYLNYYAPGQKPSVFLQEIFKHYTVLFVGYGLEEYEILEFLVKYSPETNNDECRHFMLYPMFKKNNNILRFYNDYYKDLGIRLIPYSIDNIGFEQLSIVIKWWANQISSISKPKGFYENIKFIDRVINESTS